MASHPDHDPLVSRISQPPLPGDGVPVEAIERVVKRHPGPKPKLEIRRNSTAEGETLTVAFRHRPPATSQTGTLIPGEIEAALTYYDPAAALQDACDFVTAALAAVRANVRRDA